MIMTLVFPVFCCFPSIKLGCIEFNFTINVLFYPSLVYIYKIVFNGRVTLFKFHFPARPFSQTGEAGFPLLHHVPHIITICQSVIKGANASVRVALF